jgi:hypothetical protein
MKNLDYIIQKALKTIVSEQAAAPVSKETDNAPSSAVDSPFTPAEQKFLGKFDAYGTRHIGIIYSTSDIGIREFITRSGFDLNISAGILASLLKQKIIKIVPYTGFGRNTDYTIELQLSLDDVKGLGAEDKEKAEAGSSASGAPADGGAPIPEPPAEPATEVSWVIPYGTLIKEATNIATKLIKQPLMEATKQVDAKVKGKVWVKPSRMLKDMPPQFIKHLDQLITYLSKRSHTKSQQERLIADILDNLAINLKLNSKQIRKSYELHKNQNKLQSVLDLTESRIFEDNVDPKKIPAINAIWGHIQDAMTFWKSIKTAFDVNRAVGNFNEDLFYTTCEKRIKSRQHAIVIDAIGSLLYAASIESSDGEAAYDFFDDNFTATWAKSLPIQLKDKSENYSIVKTLTDLFTSIDLYWHVFDEEDKFSKLKNQIRGRGVGTISKTDSYHTSGFYPTYSDVDVNKVKATILAPYKTK